MEPNPFESPQQSPAPQAIPAAESFWENTVVLQTAVGALACLVVIQWLCQFFTALAMLGWMKMAVGGPTAKALDTNLYGVLCLGFSGALTLAPAVIAFGYFYSRVRHILRAHRP
jgi:hypothetical protein